MERFFLVCLGGALGTGTRYLVALGAAKTLGTDFPFGTLIVNVVGCFLIALVMATALGSDKISPNLRFFLTTGFMGGLTTYSSFNYDTTTFVEERAWRAAFANFSLTVILCFIAGMLGLAAARRFVL